MNPNLRQLLVRTYYLSEALAYYESYYAPMVQTVISHDLENKLRHLKQEGRSEDRPLTWVPLVFHCTTFQGFQEIVNSGIIRRSSGGYVSLTEMPPAELDRMKIRHRGEPQVAIAFPRRYIESIGFSSVLYLQYNEAVRNEFHANGVPEFLKPFVELNDDLAAFQEIRTGKDIPIKEAVWLLTTETTSDSGPNIPAWKTFISKYGRIPKSDWHRTHQWEIFGEWQYVKISKNDEGSLDDFHSIGEFYWKQKCIRGKQISARTPKGKLTLVFAMRDESCARQFEGPYRHLDVARRAAELLLEDDSGCDNLPHRLLNTDDLMSS